MIYAGIEIFGYIFNKREVEIIETKIKKDKNIEEAVLIENKNDKKKKGSN